jgi:hypothetical protein
MASTEGQVNRIQEFSEDFLRIYYGKFVLIEFVFALLNK